MSQRLGIVGETQAAKEALDFASRILSFEFNLKPGT